MKKTKYFYALAAVMLLSSFLIGACGTSDADATPTCDVEEIQTLAVGTFASGLTETALAMPTDTPTPTLTPSPTLTITPASTNTPFVVNTLSVAPTTSCNSMAYVADVNIPDNTKMNPGQAFTKTWRVKNNGTCVWEAGSKFNFVGGDAMGSSALVLAKSVNPGEETELSVAMIAPSTPGNIRSTWRMSTATGTFFGDEVYVLITVGGSGASATPGTSTPATSTSTTVAGTATEVETATASPTTVPSATPTK